MKSLYLSMCSWELVKGAALRSSLTNVDDPEVGHTELDTEVGDTLESQS